MPARSRVSVVIPAFNSADYLNAAIDSALNQTAPPLEVIVINDGSIDNTGEVIKKYGNSIRSFYQENSGPAVARNRGIEEANGDLIAFLDADDTWALDKLEIQLSYLNRNPDVKIIHTDYMNVNMCNGKITTPNTPKNLRDVFVGNCYREFFLRNGVHISSVMVLKECLINVGGFDPNIRRASIEDYDLWFRIARHYEFGYVNIPLIYYRHHDANATRAVVAILEGELYVLNKAVQADPHIVELVGMKEVRDRLHNLYFEVGYGYHDAQSATQARHFFIEALRLHPRNFYTWVLLITNCLPSGLVRRLRIAKTSLKFKFEKLL